MGGLSPTSGQRAEAAAASYLESRDYEVLETNWRTKWCEVDIVAKRQKAIYFCEVKYRANSQQGGGLDYITPKKLEQMRLGADSWVHLHDWQGEYQLMAIEVSGPDFHISDLITDL